MVFTKYRFILDNINDIIVEVNQDLLISYVNSTDKEKRGYEPYEILNKHISTLVYQEDVLLCNNFITPIKNSKQDDYQNNKLNIKVRLVLKGGGYIWGEILIKPTYYNNQFSGFVGVIRDITLEMENFQKLIETQKQLEDSIKLKDTLFSIIAHDLRGPIHNFIYYTEILSKKYDEMDVEKKKHLNQQLSNSVVKLNTLLENLLTWSQIQRGLVHTVFKPVDAKELIEKTISQAEQLSAKKEIEIIGKYDGDWSINVDENMIDSAIRNLLGNAIKFSNRNSKIFVILEDDIQNIRIIVKDYGIGIPEDKIPNLFILGSKIGRLGTEGEPSSGLGLIICKDFVERNQGKLEAESQVGEGTQFVITLPKYYS